MSTVIGITGQIGSGKSTAASVFAEMGAAVINADKIGREVVENNPVLISKLTKTFGQVILTPSGKLKRKKVAEIAFSSQKRKKQLDKLVHPFLLKELRSSIKRLSGIHKVIVIDAALLLDWKLDKVMNQVLAIASKTKKRQVRLQKRGMSASDVKARQKWQLTENEFRRRSDKIIVNNSSKSVFQKKVADWARQFFESN